MKVFKTAQTNGEGWQKTDQATIAAMNVVFREAYPAYELKDFANPDAQPTSPQNGDAYLVDSAGTCWGQTVLAKQIICRVSGTWTVLPETIDNLHDRIAQNQPGERLLGGIGTAGSPTGNELTGDYYEALITGVYSHFTGISTISTSAGSKIKKKVDGNWYAEIQKVVQSQIQQQIGVSKTNVISQNSVSEALKAFVKAIDSSLNFKGFAQVGDTMPEATINSAYLAIETGQIFGKQVVAGQILVGDGSNFFIKEINTLTTENGFGYIHAIRDIEGKILWGILEDSSVVWSKGMSAELAAIMTQIGVNGHKILSDNNYTIEDKEKLSIQLVTENAEWAFAIYDSENKILYGVRKDGTFTGLGLSDNNYTSADKEKLASITQQEIESLEYRYIIRDSEGKIVFGIKEDGSINGLDLSTLINQITAINNQLTTINSIIGTIPAIVCDGDSLTAAGYPSLLQNLVGSSATVINRGVGGENSLTIAARQGGIPMYISNVTIPADGSYVQIGNLSNSGMYSLHNDSQVKPLLQGGSTHINPCYIAGIECTLEWTGTSYNDANGIYRLKRNVAGTASFTTRAKEIIHTSTARQYREACHIIFVGQNSGWSSNTDLVDQIKKMIEFLKYKDYIVISTHGNTTTALETLFLTEFRGRYINLREYMSKYGLSDAGLTPTQADLDAIALGNCPPQLLADSVHFTNIGYQLLAKQVYIKLVELGII